MSDIAIALEGIEGVFIELDEAPPVIDVGRPISRDISPYKDAPIVGTKSFGAFGPPASFMARWFYLVLIDGGERFVIFKTERITEVWGFHRSPYPDGYLNLLPQMRQNNLFWEIVYILKKTKRQRV
jgi:hypothetical protein